MPVSVESSGTTVATLSPSPTAALGLSGLRSSPGAGLPLPPMAVARLPPIGVAFGISSDGGAAAWPTGPSARLGIVHGRTARATGHVVRAHQADLSEAAERR